MTDGNNKSRRKTTSGKSTAEDDLRVAVKNYLAILVGSLFIFGGLLQLIYGEINLSYHTGDLLVGVAFLLPGILAVCYGVLNLVRTMIENQREKKRILAEKFGYLKLD